MRDRHKEWLWKKPGGIAELVRQKNPQCQRIIDGKQCPHAPTVTHHLEDPKETPQKMYDWNNLVALCEKCHPGGQPGNTQGHVYCHTIGVAGAVYFHHCWPAWRPEFITKQPTARQAELIAEYTAQGVWH